MIDDLSPIGWIGVGMSALSGVWLLSKVPVWFAVESPDFVGNIALAIVAIGLGLAIAYEDARPEVDSCCNWCGERVTASSSRERAEEYVEVGSVGAPQRANLGPLSIITNRRAVDRVYCSGECADKHPRYIVGEESVSTEGSDRPPMTDETEMMER